VREVILAGGMLIIELRLPRFDSDSRPGALAIWTVAASVVSTGTTLTWLSLGEALGFVVIALTGLVAHELATEHIVHALEAVPGKGRESSRAEEFSAAA
jgi:hypothetical protein